jgi:Uracil-DNA glycosylase
VRTARLARIRDPHVARLNRLVEEIRSELDCDGAVPYFDPADGGERAKCLFVLEAPGARAVQSGFVSRDNPDETAKNFLLLNAEAEIPREVTATWNIVPWYIGTTERIRAATLADVSAGWPYLQRALELLPEVRVVALLGQKAQRIRQLLASSRPDLSVIGCPHPSPLFINRAPGNRLSVLAALREVAGHLTTGRSRPQGAA